MILNQVGSPNECKDDRLLTSNDMEKVLELQNSVLLRRRLQTFPYPDFGYRPGLNIFSDDSDNSANVLEQQKLIQNLLKHYQSTLLDEGQWLGAGGLLNFPKRFEDVNSEEARNEEVRKRLKRDEEGKVFTKQRKTNFTAKEVETLLNCVADKKDVILFGVAGGKGWARAWQEIARIVSKVEGIDRTEGDVRKKWTYLKWEAKNTSKPGRDPVSKHVLNILTSRDREVAEAMSMREALDPFPPATEVPPGIAINSLGHSSSQTSSPIPQLLRHSPAASPPSSEHSSKKSLPALAPKSQVQRPREVKSPVVKLSPKVVEANTEVCLRWNSYNTNMKNTFPSLLNNEQFVDVTLACDGRSIKCHKVMLSVCSPYLEELLSSNPCQHPIIFLKDMEFWQLAALVDFMYRGEVNVKQMDLPSLLAAAEALQIKGLAGPSAPASQCASESDRSSYYEQFSAAVKTEMDEEDTDNDADDNSNPPSRPKKRKFSDATHSSSGGVGVGSGGGGGEGGGGGGGMIHPVNGKKPKDKELTPRTTTTALPANCRISQTPPNSRISLTSPCSRISQAQSINLNELATNAGSNRDNGYKSRDGRQISVVKQESEDMDIGDSHAKFILEKYSHNDDSYSREEDDDDGSNG